MRYTETTVTKSNKKVGIRIRRVGTNGALYAELVAGNGRVIAETDIIRPRDCEAAAYDDARALAARI